MGPGGAAPASSDDGSRVVVFGGTFDPPHLAHVQMVRAARVRGHRVLVVVSALPPHREAAAAGAPLRLELARAAFGGLQGVEVLDVELVRAQATGAPSYMADTLAELAANSQLGRSRPLLLVGGDQAVTLGRWHRPDLVLGAADVAVVERFPATDGTQHGMLDAHQQAELEALALRHGARVEVWPERVPGIAAHHIRALVAEGNLAQASSLVPPWVAPMLEGAYGTTVGAGPAPA